MGAETVIIGSIKWGTVYNFLILTGINYLIARNQNRTPRDTDGVKTRVPSSTQNKLPVVYGRQEVGGSIIFADISSDNQTLYYIIALAEECDKIHSIYWNDKLVQLATRSGTFPSYVYTNVPEGTFTAGTLYYANGTTDYAGNSDNFLNTKLRVAFYPRGGRCTQMQTNSTRWNTNSANRTMPNTAYMYVELDYDADDRVVALPNNFRAIVDGIIPDRVLVNNASNNYVRNKTNTDTYTTSPADCILDYMTNTRYGAGISIDDIDTESLYNHKVFCEDMFFDRTSTVGASTVNVFINRYMTNIALDTRNRIGDNLLALTVGNGSNIVWKGNQFGVVTLTQRTSQMNFSEDNIFGDLNVTKSGFQSKYNEVTVRYVNTMPTQSEKQLTVITPTNQRNMNEPRLAKEIAVPTCSSDKEALRIGEIFLANSRLDTNVVFKTNLSANELRAGDVISVTHGTASWTNKLFSVEVIRELTRNNFIELEISAREYSDATYPMKLTITNLTAVEDDDIAGANLVVSWTISNSTLSREYEYQFKPTTLSEYPNVPARLPSNSTTFTLDHTDNIVASTTYDVRVRSISTQDALGDWFTTQGTTGA